MMSKHKKTQFDFPELDAIRPVDDGRSNVLVMSTYKTGKTLVTHADVFSFKPADKPGGFESREAELFGDYSKTVVSEPCARISAALVNQQHADALLMLNDVKARAVAFYEDKVTA